MSLSNPRLLDRDEFTGITEWFHYDEDTDGFIIESRQDVEPILETNKALWNNTEKHTRYGELTRIASVPNVILMELVEKKLLTFAGKILDEKGYTAWLNDSANKHWRTRMGRV